MTETERLIAECRSEMERASNLVNRASPCEHAVILRNWATLLDRAASEIERLQAENVKLHRPADEALLHLESMARELAARPEPAEISVWYDGEMYWAEASAMDGWAGYAPSACELLLAMPGEATDGTHNHQD